MNEEYWIKYYKETPKQDPSNFAKFCLSHIPEGSKIIDLAAGDGRDTDLLCTKGVCIPVEPHNDSIALNYLEEVEYTDVVYARWFFHAVEENIEDKVLQWCKNHCVTLMTEIRAEKSDDDSHERRVIDSNEFLGKLVRLGFDIAHYEKSRGFSKVGDDDPLLFRVIATYNNERRTRKII
jgi:hypothetical protein